MVKLYQQLKDRSEIPYPDPDEQTATYGSRVHIIEEDGYESVFDLATHYIPGMPSEEDVTVISPDSPIAKEIYGSKEGETIVWKAPSGKEFRATVTKINQLAVQNFFRLLEGTTE